jgi:MinD superfamily P-loop ATPase
LSIKKGKQIYFNKDLCRGCGVCSTACPEEAIAMIPLDTCNETHSLITQVIGEPKPASGKSESTTTRKAGGLDFTAIGGKRHGREVP